MSRQDGVHTPIGPCWCGSGCHHGGYHAEPSDLRFDDKAQKAFCVRTGVWVPGAYSEHSPKGQEIYERKLTLNQRRTYRHRRLTQEKESTTSGLVNRGKKGYRWVILRDGRRVQVAVASNPGHRRGGANVKGEDLSKTRRDRLVQREQAPAPMRSRRGVVSSSTTRARKFLGLAKRDDRGNLHDPATGRFTKKG